MTPPPGASDAPDGIDASDGVALADLRLVVAGGSPLVASSVRAALTGAGSLASATGPADVLERARAHEVDVLVAATRVGATDLADLLPEVLTRSVRVLVVCARPSLDAVPELLLGGAAGFLLLEETTPEQLREAVATTARGGAALHPAVAMTVLRQWRELRSGQRPVLTAKETEVLRAMAGGAPVKAIARSLGLSARTVESHGSRIYTKLGARGRVQAVARAMELGMLQPEDAGPA